MTTTQETPADEATPSIEEQVRRAIGEVGPAALAQIAHEHEAGHVYTAMWELMKDVAWIGKTGRMSAGGGGNYDYREIEQVIAALGNRARVYGLALQTEIVRPPEYVEHQKKKSNGDVTVWTTCRGLVMRFSWTSLRDGTTLSAEGLGEGRDSADKASNKAVTAAYKQAMTHSTLLPTFDAPDPDGDRPEVGNDGPVGDDPADAPEPSETEVLAAIRQAADMDTLTSIREWLMNRDALGVEVEGQAFGDHLEAARRTIQPDVEEMSGSEQADGETNGAQGGGPHD